MTNAPVRIQNISALPQHGWVFVGLPAVDMPEAEAGWLATEQSSMPWVREPHGVRVLASVPASSTIKCSWSDEPRKLDAFVWHPILADNALAILPQFKLAGAGPTTSSLDLVRSSPAAIVWRIRDHWAAEKVTVDCWLTVSSGMASVEFTTQVVYGTTENNGQAQAVDLPEVTMTSRARIHFDFAKRNGQEQAQQFSNLPTWRGVIRPAGRAHRAARWESRGVLLPFDDVARRDAPLSALYMGWADKWMALGKIVEATPDLPQVRETQWQQYNFGRGSMLDMRPRCQPRETGTTGDQPDFGCASDLAVTTGDPWEIHDALWQCQSFALRPTGNREPGGAPMRAELHPKATIYNQRVDLAYGVEDRLGWPGVNQIGWMPSPATTLWTAADDQHRSDNFLHATYALTRDPALEQLILDHIELDKLDVYYQQPMVPSPRSVGRMALTRANQIWLGFTGATQVARTCAQRAIVNSPLSTLPPDREIRTIGGREQAKYGWSDANGQPVIGWQSWQETIAAIGLLALGKQLRDGEMINSAMRLAQTVVTQCFDLATRRHAYAVRWMEGDVLGTGAWPTSVNSAGEGWTSFIYVSPACQSWSMASAVMIAEINQQAHFVLTSFPPAQRINDARWRAL